MLEVLGVNFKEIIFAFVNFLLLVFILWKLLYKPITEMLDKRKKIIEDSLHDADKARRIAEAQKESYDRQIANAYAEAQGIINDAKNKAAEQADEIIADANKKAEEIKAQAALSIENERAKAMSEMKTEIANLASLAAAQILEREVSKSNNDEIVNNIIERAGREGWKS